MGLAERAGSAGRGRDSKKKRKKGQWRMGPQAAELVGRCSAAAAGDGG